LITKDIVLQNFSSSSFGFYYVNIYIYLSSKLRWFNKTTIQYKTVITAGNLPPDRSLCSSNTL